MSIPQDVRIPNFPGAKRFIEMYQSGYSMNAMAEDAVLKQTVLVGIDNPRSRSWAIYHRIKRLIGEGILQERPKKGVELENKPSGREIAVVVGDIHAPYHDEKAVEISRQIILHVQPDYVFINGDTLDFYQISRFDSLPHRKVELQKDLDVGKKILKDYREAAPNAVMKLREGNHEARLNHWRSRNPEIGVLNCLRLENLLELDSIKCDLIPERQQFTWNGWTITHGALARKLAGYTAQGMIDKYGTSGVSNHVHRLAIVERRNMKDDFVWIENGCLCSLKPDFMELADWSHGMTVLTYEGGEVWPELIRIKNGEAFYRGQYIKV